VRVKRLTLLFYLLYLFENGYFFSLSFRRFLSRRDVLSRRLVSARWAVIFEKRMRILWPVFEANRIHIASAINDCVTIEKVSGDSTVKEPRLIEFMFSLKRRRANSWARLLHYSRFFFAVTGLPIDYVMIDVCSVFAHLARLAKIDTLRIFLKRSLRVLHRPSLRASQWRPGIWTTGSSVCDFAV
jgi:hypothetical protein